MNHPDPRDIRAYMAWFLQGQEHAAIIGPLRDAGGPNGLVLRGGEAVREWGDTARVDMAFSVSKSFINACAGVAFDRGLIDDVHEPVVDGATWHQLLQQTSNWSGTVWGKPDTCDPGERIGAWNYNDVRVNRLAIALRERLGAPLPDVLRSTLLPGEDWEWHGYSNSGIDVSGGGHWGGGVFASTHALARFGEAYRTGALSAGWVARTREPCPDNPRYGYLFWLDGADAFYAEGSAGHTVWIHPGAELTIVTRWTDRQERDRIHAASLKA